MPLSTCFKNQASVQGHAPAVYQHQVAVFQPLYKALLLKLFERLADHFAHCG